MSSITREIMNKNIRTAMRKKILNLLKSLLKKFQGMAMSLSGSTKNLLCPHITRQYSDRKKMLQDN